LQVYNNIQAWLFFFWYANIEYFFPKFQKLGSKLLIRWNLLWLWKSLILNLVCCNLTMSEYKMLSNIRTTLTFFVFLLFLTVSACERSASPPPADTADAAADQTAMKSPAENYKQYCAQCHEGGVLKAPHSVTFQMIGTRAILKSMIDGVMQLQAKPMSSDEIHQLAEHLGGSTLDSASALPLKMCDADVAAQDPEMLPKSSDWGIDPQNTRFITDGIAALEASDVPQLRLKWAFAYPNSTRARSQPVIAGNTVFMGSQDGTIYALDLASGCVRWTFAADAEVRSAVSIEAAHDGGDGRGPMAYFGDFIGQVYALDATSGTLVWKSSVEDHHNVTITGSPKLHKGRLYVPLSSSEWASAADPAYECCTFRGGIAAFDTADGRMVWKSHTITEQPQLTGAKNRAGAAMWAPAGAPIWGSLTIDEKRNRIYAGTGQAYTSPAADSSDSIIAFNLDTGDIEWVYQATKGDAWNMSCFIGEAANCPEEDGPDFDFGAPPVLLTLSNGRDIILVGQKSGFVHALDPRQQGALIWKKRIGLGGFAGGVHWGMAAHNDVLYAPNADTNFINKWQGERTPGLYALKAETGEQIWFTPAPDVCAEEDKPECDPGLSASVNAIPGVVFAGGFDGRLRAYDSLTGEIIWDFNTAREFETLSGEMARGGSIESDGPAIAHGHVLINSGYLFGGRMGGNVLLAFTVDGQ
jgi:polyvinyl alcohol dehydrogenase (cytochrome)